MPVFASVFVDITCVNVGASSERPEPFTFGHIKIYDKILYICLSESW